MNTFAVIFAFFIVIVAGGHVRISYQISAIDDDICKSSPATQNLEWHDEACHKFKCEIQDGVEKIVVTACHEPETPQNSLACKRLRSGDLKLKFPLCCPKLLCLVKTDNKISLHIVGQPEHSFIDEPLNNDMKLEKLYQILSSTRLSEKSPSNAYDTDDG